MHTVELLDRAIAIASQRGIMVRQDWMGGSGGGSCVLKGQTWLFLDLGQDASEQLQIVLAALEQLDQPIDLEHQSSANGKLPKAA